MKINNNIYLKMLTCPNVPPETGGILGSKNGIICEYFFDEGLADSSRAIYKPDIDKLNKQISIWNNERTAFCGIAHTHIFGQHSLSDDDIIYIKSIMNSMPASVKFLYFPIIIPKQYIFPYKAFRNGNNISIVSNRLIII